MVVKFHCRKCGKRFVDWGAEKLAYKCPDCEGEALVRMGSPDDKPVKRPSLKRKPRRVAVAPVADEEEDILPVVDAEPLEEEDGIAQDEDIEEDADLVEESDTDDEDVEEAGAFESITPAMGEKEDETAETDEWTA